MEYEITCDPTCIITHRGLEFLIYYQIETQESWIIYGICTQKGSCMDGALNEKPVLDCPVRPEIECDGCNLRGVYL